MLINIQPEAIVCRYLFTAKSLYGLYPLYRSLRQKHGPRLRDVGRTSIYCRRTCNPLTPNDPHRGRTAPLTSKRSFYIFIQQI